MKYIATVDSQKYEIELNVDDMVTLGGNDYPIDFLDVSEQAVYNLLIGGKSYEAVIAATDSGWQVLVRGQLYSVDVEDERQQRLRQIGGGPEIEAGEYKLTAPMPGLIVSINVSEGEEFKKGHNLVVLESMKMQNELKAPRDGKIGQILIKEGDSVEQNQVLVALE